MGITRPTFNISGKIPYLILSLKSSAMSGAMMCDTFLMINICILLTVDFLFLNAFITDETSAVVVSKNTNELVVDSTHKS